MKPARVEIAAPGSLPTYVVRAPFAAVPPSTRAPRIEALEKDLASELVALEEGTKKRNLQFYTSLDGIEEHAQAWEAKLRAEAEEQRASHEELVKMFDSMMSATCYAEKKAIINDVERFHTDKIPLQVCYGILVCCCGWVADAVRIRSLFLLPGLRHRSG